MKKAWSVEFLDDVVEAEFLAIPKDLQARLVRIADLIESHGLENFGMPYVRHLQDKLWEIRGKGRSGIARALYVTSTGVCEEDPKNTARRSCSGIVSNEGD